MKGDGVPVRGLDIELEGLEWGLGELEGEVGELYKEGAGLEREGEDAVDRRTAKRGDEKRRYEPDSDSDDTVGPPLTKAILRGISRTIPTYMSPLQSFANTDNIHTNIHVTTTIIC